MRYSDNWMNGQIRAITEAARDVRVIEILPDSPHPYTPGAHINVRVFINGEPAIRSYSLVGVYQRDKPYAIGVKRLPDSRGGSEYMWSLDVGAKLSISQPQNHFELTYERDAYLIIAGGIGITPIISMVEELVHKQATVRLLYAGSSRADMPFLGRLTNLLGDNLSLHVSDEDTRLAIPDTIRALPPGTQVYVCGPLRMLDDVRQIWHECQLPVGDLRYETFGTTGLYATQAFDVRLPRFGKTITVAKNQSLLDALNSNGIDVMSDCERGDCGLCTVHILSCTGTVDHRDLFFSDAQKAENKKMCACVSRVVNGDIVIDTSYRGVQSLPMPDYLRSTP